MKTSFSRLLLAAFAVCLLGTSGTAYAVCNQSTASQADKDLWATHGCWQQFFLWQYKAYDVRKGDWQNRGFFDACNKNVEYPKHWNASYLVTYGLLDDLSKSWHGAALDYRPLAEHASSKFKASVYHTATDTSGIFGAFVPHVFDSNEVQTACPLYDPALAINANPASRAGDFMHEGWHGWLRKYNYNNGNVGGHRPMQGNCTVNGCDYFYWHGLGAYAFGAMYQTDGTAKRFHSPNQAQVEFLCDVADVSKSWVPNSVRLTAKTDANQRATQRFINGPGYFCGNPRPW